MVKTLTDRLYPVESSVYENWTKPGTDAGVLKEQVLSRAAYFGLAPAYVITSALDTLIGMGGAICTIATLGQHKKTYRFTQEFIVQSRFMPAVPFLLLLRTFNPQAQILSDAANGFSSAHVIKTLQKKIDGFNESTNFFHREISSRLTFVSLALCCVITRVYDFIIGVCATFLAFLTLGKNPSLNQMAYENLQVTMLVADLFVCAIGLLNPRSYKFLSEA